MTQRKLAACCLVASALLFRPAPAAAQGSFGAGPITSSLIDTEPTTGVLNFARMKIAPGIIIQEFGRDENVFDEKENPKEDFVVRGTPDASIFARTRFVQVSTYAGVPLSYFKKYRDERFAGVEYRGRVDLLAGRLRPFIGAGRNRTRSRPNGEVDVRADLDRAEVSTGIGYDFGPDSLIYGAFHDYHEHYRDAHEEGVDLATALNRYSRLYSVGVRTDLTPLTTVTLSGGLQQDRFKFSPERNDERRRGGVAVNIGAEAALSGVIDVSYQDVRPADPLIEPFRGVTAQLAVTYPVLEIGRISLRGVRGFEYSFEVEEAYYKETTVILTYTQRLVYRMDLRGEGSKSFFDYGFRQGTPPHVDELESVTASLGYNLPNRTRVALNYELARRRSPAFEDRNYDRRRLFVSWTFAN